MNRISRLLHKTYLLSRQRRAVNHAHRYVIYDEDLNASENKDPFARGELDDPDVHAQKILEGFDPENDKMDRRILFEVTGLTFLRDEFLDEDSSDSEGELLSNENTRADPLKFAFDYQSVLNRSHNT